MSDSVALYSTNCARHSLGHGVCVGENVALPKAKNSPSLFRKVLSLLPVSVDVPLHLRDPIRRVMTTGEFRQSLLKVAAMPEIAVAEDENSILRKHEIRDTNEARVIFSERQTHRTEFCFERSLTRRALLATCSSSRAGGSIRRWREFTVRRTLTQRLPQVMRARFAHHFYRSGHITPSAARAPKTIF